MTAPGLFGINRSNRDFNDPETWGKNQFNSSFPAALGCYFYSKGLEANYLKIGSKGHEIGSLSIPDLFGAEPLDDDIFFSFESAYAQYSPLVVGKLPGTDLVICSSKDASKQFRPLEIKLTALPDKVTSTLSEADYGSELVVRPDTILYLCCQLFQDNEKNIKEAFSDSAVSINDPTDPQENLDQLPEMVKTLRSIISGIDRIESPFLMQPIWKTIGQSSVLDENSLDIFVWSTLSFLSFVCDIGQSSPGSNMTRQSRTVVWIYSSLRELSTRGKTNFRSIVDALSFNTKNDKAFAANGKVTNPYMKSINLEIPRIRKSEIKNIILGGGQNYLSPERRFDAIIVNSPEIFS